MTVMRLGILVIVCLDLLLIAQAGRLLVDIRRRKRESQVVEKVAWYRLISIVVTILLNLFTLVVLIAVFLA